MNINESLREQSLLMLFSIGLSFFTQSFIQVSILRREILNLVALMPTLPDYPEVSRIWNESPGLPYG